MCYKYSNLSNCVEKLPEKNLSANNQPTISQQSANIQWPIGYLLAERVSEGALLHNYCSLDDKQ